MKSNSLGKIAEEMSVNFLISKGYGVISRNYYSCYGEIDIIAVDEDSLVFVEVKARKGDYRATLSNVSQSKRLKLIKTALIFIQEYSTYESYLLRFDVISVVKTGVNQEYRIEHLIDAFRVDDLYDEDYER